MDLVHVSLTIIEQLFFIKSSAHTMKLVILQFFKLNIECALNEAGRPSNIIVGEVMYARIEYAFVM